MSSNLNYIYRLRDEYSKKLEKIISTNKKFKESYRKSALTLNKYASSNIRKIREQSLAHSEVSKKIVSNVQRTKASINSQGQSFVAHNRGVIKSSNDVRKLTQETNRYVRANDQLKRSTRNWERHQKAIEKNKFTLNKLRAGSRDILGKGLANTAIGVAGLALLNKPIDVAREYELAFKDVKKSFQGTDKDLEVLKNSFKKFKGATFAEVSAVAAEVAKMGLSSAKEVEALTFNIIKSSKALDFEPGEAVEQIGKILTMTNQMDKPIKASQRIVDSVVHMENSLSATKGADVLNVWKRTSEVMAQLDFDHDQMAGMAASLVQLGVAPELAASGFRSLVNQFKRTKIGRVWLKDLKEQGPQALKKIAADLSKINVEDRLKLTGAYGSQLAEKLLIEENLAKVFNAIDVSKQASGAAEREWAIFRGTYDEKLRDFKKVFANTMVILGNTLIPIMIELFRKVNPILIRTGAWIEKNKTLVKNVALVTLAILGVLTALGAFQLAVAAGGFAIAGLMSIIKAAVIVWKSFFIVLAMAKKAILVLKMTWILFNAAFAVTPIGLIVVAIGALIAIVLVARKKLGSWGDAFKFLGQLMLKSLLTPINLLIAGIAKVMKVASFMPGKVGDMAGKASAEISKFTETFNEKLTGNKSLTALGMGYDLLKGDVMKNKATADADKMTAVKDMVSGESRAMALNRRKSDLSVNSYVSGDIRVRADKGTKVTNKTFGFDSGKNLAFQ